MTGNVTFDYSKLRGRIVEKYGTSAKFCKDMQISRATLSKKLNDVVGFNQQEIFRAAKLLGISLDSLEPYFFTPIVTKMEL